MHRQLAVCDDAKRYLTATSARVTDASSQYEHGSHTAHSENCHAMQKLLSIGSIPMRRYLAVPLNPFVMQRPLSNGLMLLVDIC